MRLGFYHRGVVDFTLTPEQEALRDLARDFATREIRPVAWDLDRSGGWPRDVIAKAHAVGLMNPYLPRRYGGPQLGTLDVALIEEELAWGCAGIQTALGANGLAMTPVLLAGSETVQQEFFTELAERPCLASFCLTEPGAGSDAAALSLSAEKRGTKYTLRGSKAFVSNGGHADWLVVFARTGGAGPGGISAFLVRRDESIIADREEDKLGQRAANTVPVTFDGTEVDARYMLGAEGSGFALAMNTLDRTRPSVAAMAVGIARAALEYAAGHAREREQFGRPLAEHQGIQFMIADMATKVHLSRLAVWNAAICVDQGKPSRAQSAHAKRFAADSAMEVTTDAVQIYGGYGYLRDYPVEKLMRDAKIMQLYEGTSQIQRLVIAREVLMPRKVEQPAAAAAA